MTAAMAATAAAGGAIGGPAIGGRAMTRRAITVRAITSTAAITATTAGAPITGSGAPMKAGTIKRLNATKPPRFHRMAAAEYAHIWFSSRSWRCIVLSLPPKPKTMQRQSGAVGMRFKNLIARLTLPLGWLRSGFVLVQSVSFTK